MNKKRNLIVNIVNTIQFVIFRQNDPKYNKNVVQIQLSTVLDKKPIRNVSVFLECNINSEGLFESKLY